MVSVNDKIIEQISVNDAALKDTKTKLDNLKVSSSKIVEGKLHSKTRGLINQNEIDQIEVFRLEEEYELERKRQKEALEKIQFLELENQTSEIEKKLNQAKKKSQELRKQWREEFASFEVTGEDFGKLSAEEQEEKLNLGLRYLKDSPLEKEKQARELNVFHDYRKYNVDESDKLFDKLQKLNPSKGNVEAGIRKLIEDAKSAKQTLGDYYGSLVEKREEYQKNSNVTELNKISILEDLIKISGEEKSPDQGLKIIRTKIKDASKTGDVELKLQLKDITEISNQSVVSIISKADTSVHKSFVGGYNAIQNFADKNKLNLAKLTMDDITHADRNASTEEKIYVIPALKNLVQLGKDVNHIVDKISAKAFEKIFVDPSKLSDLNEAAKKAAEATIKTPDESFSALVSHNKENTFGVIDRVYNYYNNYYKKLLEPRDEFVEVFNDQVHNLSEDKFTNLPEDFDEEMRQVIILASANADKNRTTYHDELMKFQPNVENNAVNALESGQMKSALEKAAKPTIQKPMEVLSSLVAYLNEDFLEQRDDFLRTDYDDSIKSLLEYRDDDCELRGQTLEMKKFLLALHDLKMDRASADEIKQSIDAAAFDFLDDKKSALKKFFENHSEEPNLVSLSDLLSKVDNESNEFNIGVNKILEYCQNNIKKDISYNGQDISEKSDLAELFNELASVAFSNKEKDISIIVLPDGFTKEMHNVMAFIGELYKDELEDAYDKFFNLQKQIKVSAFQNVSDEEKKSALQEASKPVQSFIEELIELVPNLDPDKENDISAGIAKIEALKQLSVQYNGIEYNLKANPEEFITLVKAMASEPDKKLPAQITDEMRKVLINLHEQTKANGSDFSMLLENLEKNLKSEIFLKLEDNVREEVLIKISKPTQRTEEEEIINQIISFYGDFAAVLEAIKELQDDIKKGFIKQSGKEIDSLNTFGELTDINNIKSNKSNTPEAIDKKLYDLVRVLYQFGENNVENGFDKVKALVFAKLDSTTKNNAAGQLVPQLDDKILDSMNKLNALTGVDFEDKITQLLQKAKEIGHSGLQSYRKGDPNGLHVSNKINLFGDGKNAQGNDLLFLESLAEIDGAENDSEKGLKIMREKIAEHDISLVSLDDSNVPDKKFHQAKEYHDLYVTGKKILRDKIQKNGFKVSLQYGHEAIDRLVDEGLSSNSNWINLTEEMARYQAEIENIKKKYEKAKETILGSVDLQPDVVSKKSAFDNANNKLVKERENLAILIDKEIENNPVLKEAFEKENVDNMREIDRLKAIMKHQKHEQDLLKKALTDTGSYEKIMGYTHKSLEGVERDFIKQLELSDIFDAGKGNKINFEKRDEFLQKLEKAVLSKVNSVKDSQKSEVLDVLVSAFGDVDIKHGFGRVEEFIHLLKDLPSDYKTKEVNPRLQSFLNEGSEMSRSFYRKAFVDVVLKLSNEEEKQSLGSVLEAVAGSSESMKKKKVEVAIDSNSVLDVACDIIAGDKEIKKSFDNKNSEVSSIEAAANTIKENLVRKKNKKASHIDGDEHSSERPAGVGSKVRKKTSEKTKTKRNDKETSPSEETDFSDDKEAINTNKQLKEYLAKAVMENKGVINEYTIAGIKGDTVGKTNEKSCEVLDNGLIIFNYRNIENLQQHVRDARKGHSISSISGQSQERYATVVCVGEGENKEYKVVTANAKGIRISDLSDKDREKYIENAKVERELSDRQKLKRGEKISEKLIGEYCQDGFNIDRGLKKEFRKQCQNEGINLSLIHGRKSKLEAAMDNVAFASDLRDGETVVEQDFNNSNRVTVTMGSGHCKDAVIAIGNGFYINVNGKTGEVEDKLYYKPTHEKGFKEIDLDRNPVEIKNHILSVMQQRVKDNDNRAYAEAQAREVYNSVVQKYNNLEVLVYKDQGDGNQDVSFLVEGKNHGMRFSETEKNVMSFFTGGLSNYALSIGNHMIGITDLDSKRMDTGNKIDYLRAVPGVASFYDGAQALRAIPKNLANAQQEPSRVIEPKSWMQVFSRSSRARD